MSGRVTVILIIAAVAVALAFGVAGYRTTGFAQNVLVELAGTAVSLAIGLLIVNVYLQRDERRRGADPLLKMIGPSIQKWHNDYFIEKGRVAFGIPAFHALIDVYQSNGGNPQALSPEQRDGLFQIIKTIRPDVLPLLDTIHDQLKELSQLLGWSFSPTIVRIALECRLNIVKFKNLQLSEDAQTKLDACELYLDIEATAGAVFEELTRIRGLKKQEWQSANRP